jgi:hypothetical protein
LSENCEKNCSIGKEKYYLKNEKMGLRLCKVGKLTLAHQKAKSFNSG